MIRELQGRGDIRARPKGVSKICFTKELAIGFLLVTIFFLVPFNYPRTDLHTLLEAQLLCKLNLSNPSPGLSPL